MGLQRVEHDLATEWQQSGFFSFFFLTDVFAVLCSISANTAMWNLKKNCTNELIYKTEIETQM